MITDVSVNASKSQVSTNWRETTGKQAANIVIRGITGHPNEIVGKIGKPSKVGYTMVLIQIHDGADGCCGFHIRGAVAPPVIALPLRFEPAAKLALWLLDRFRIAWSVRTDGGQECKVDAKTDAALAPMP